MPPVRQVPPTYRTCKCKYFNLLSDRLRAYNPYFMGIGREYAIFELTIPSASSLYAPLYPSLPLCVILMYPGKALTELLIKMYPVSRIPYPRIPYPVTLIWTFHLPGAAWGWGLCFQSSSSPPPCSRRSVNALLVAVQLPAKAPHLQAENPHIIILQAINEYLGSIEFLQL